MSTIDVLAVPLLDLKRQYDEIQGEVMEAVDRVFSSTQFVLGDEVVAFEREFASYSGSQYGVAMNSGTSALHLALLAADVGPGDEVITVAMTFVATVAAIDYTGARAVLVDVDPRSYTMDVGQIEARITPRTKAIMPVHLYGQPADMDAIMQIAERHGLIVIEDAAQAHGAEYRGQRAGSIGHIGCFSFYPGKNLGAYGEGGIAVTNDAELAQKLRMLRDWGQSERYHHVLKGYNYRMDGIQGAILRIKLRRLEAWTEARRANARTYDGLMVDAGVRLPSQMEYARHVYHIYPILHAERDRLRAALQARGVHTGLHYPIPVHLQEAYSDLGYRAGDFPQAEKLAQEELSLPMFAELTQEEAEHVCASVKAALVEVGRG